MIKTLTICPGITLRCFPDTRFKQNLLTLQLVRPMCKEEAALNALIPAVLLRGCESAPDLRSITLRLDDLYGASVGALVRRAGDYQTTGLSCSFIADRYTMGNEPILQPMIRFLGQLLLQPVLEDGAFKKDYVNSEKKNLIATIDSQMNDKRIFAATQLLKHMCSNDALGIPRLGETAQVRRITAASAYAHYRKILAESRVDVFYVGPAEPETVAQLLKDLFAEVDRSYVNLPDQTPFRDAPGGEHRLSMEVTQGKLAMGYASPITNRDPRFAAMQVCNTVFGGGMTSKLFMQVREKLSLCYDIGTGYHGSKGIVTLSSGIDFDREKQVRQEVAAQLDACCRGEISEEELHSAKQAILSSLRGTHDSPGSIEGYYATAALSDLSLTPAEYMQQVQQVTAKQVAEAAQTLQLHTVFFLEGVQ